MQKPFDVTTWVSFLFFFFSSCLLVPSSETIYKSKWRESFSPFTSSSFFIWNILFFSWLSPRSMFLSSLIFYFIPSIYFPFSFLFLFRAFISPLFFLFILTVHVLASINTGGLLHELSNEGARAQFEDFLESMILPAMVFSAEVRATIHFIHSSYCTSLSVSYFFFLSLFISSLPSFFTTSSFHFPSIIPYCYLLF